MRFVVLRRLDHLRPVRVEMDHRLFAVHVLAGLHRVHRDLLVPVIRRADNDRIDILARQNLVVVARGEDVVAPDFFAAREPPVVAVGHRHQLHARHLHGRARIAHALSARANQRDLNMIVRRHRPCRLVLRRQRKDVLPCFRTHARSGCNRSRSCRRTLKKISAIPNLHSSPEQRSSPPHTTIHVQLPAKARSVRARLQSCRKRIGT